MLWALLRDIHITDWSPLGTRWKLSALRLQYAILGRGLRLLRLREYTTKIMVAAFLQKGFVHNHFLGHAGII
jgi:hypothetical protein